MRSLQNKVAFISGGTSGIGLATAKDFIYAGARVVITGRHQDTVRETVTLLGVNAFGIVSDAGVMADLYALKDNVLKFAPAIDILFANAGYGKFAPIEDVTEAMFDELYGILVKGTYFTIQQLLPIMNPGGSIILNTSIVTAYGSQYASIYSSSKAAVQSLVKTLAAEFAVRKIRVNAVSPGHTETDIYSKTGIPADQIPGIKKAITATLPLQRYAEAAEVAKAVTFLASDDASYLHGTEITVDGGYTMIR